MLKRCEASAQYIPYAEKRLRDGFLPELPAGSKFSVRGVLYVLGLSCTYEEHVLNMQPLPSPLLLSRVWNKSLVSWTLVADVIVDVVD